MKKSRILSAITAIALAVTAIAGCSGAQTPAEKANLNVGIIQFGSHPSLDNCYDGIVEGLNGSEYGSKITLDKQDGGFDAATCDTIANSMTAKNYDMIFAIATPAAISAYSAARNSNIPVIFCAVSDPVAAGLTTSLEAGTETCIGTSDVLNLDAQVDLIQSLQPDVKKIGVLYTTTEANSLTQLANLKEIAAARGLEIVEQGVSTAADIPQAAASVASKCDCINNFTDNNVVNNLSIVLEKANAAGIPVYGSEIEQVKNGCLAAVSIDYVALGKETANMGVQVLNGAKPAEMAVKTISDATPTINTEVLEQFSLTIPESYSNAELVETNK